MADWPWVLNIGLGSHKIKARFGKEGKTLTPH